MSESGPFDPEPWWEDLPEPGQLVRSRPCLVSVWRCDCGREFTTMGGRSLHQRHCEVYASVMAYMADQLRDARDAARLRENP